MGARARARREKLIFWPKYLLVGCRWNRGDLRTSRAHPARAKKFFLEKKFFPQFFFCKNIFLHLSGDIFGLRKFLTKKFFGLSIFSHLSGDTCQGTPVGGHLSRDIFGLRKFLRKKNFFGLKKIFDEKFFGLRQFLKKKIWTGKIFDEKIFGLKFLTKNFLDLDNF